MFQSNTTIYYIKLCWQQHVSINEPNGWPDDGLLEPKHVDVSISLCNKLLYLSETYILYEWDATKVMQLITEVSLMMRAVGIAVVCIVILCLQVCTKGCVSRLPVTLCYKYVFLWLPAVDGVTEHRQQTTNDIIPLWILQFQEITSLPIYDFPLQWGFMHYKWSGCFFVYNESTALTKKCVVVYRTAWI